MYEISEPLLKSKNLISTTIFYPTDHINEQLSSRSITRIRHALVHSFSFLGTLHGTELTQALAEAVTFTKILISITMAGQDFNELKECAFFQKAIARGQALESKYDEIPALTQKIEHILYIGTLQLQFSGIKEEAQTLPPGMKKSALNMLKVRMDKYFPHTSASLEESSSASVNSLTHFGPKPGLMSSDEEQEIINQQLCTTFSP